MVTFITAVSSGKNFKYKYWLNYATLKEAMAILSKDYTIELARSMMVAPDWKIEEEMVTITKQEYLTLTGNLKMVGICYKCFSILTEPMNVEDGTYTCPDCYTRNTVEQALEFKKANMTVIDDKYALMSHHGKLVALRHGEPWRNLTGDKLILAMMENYNGKE